MYNIQIKEQRYGDLVVLHHMECRVKEGDFVVIMGESGCGKTTFLNIISGIIKGYEGVKSNRKIKGDYKCCRRAL